MTDRASTAATDRRVLTLDEAELRARRTSVKWRHYDPDVLPLWVAEMDAQPAPPVVAALRRLADDGDLGYPVPEVYVASVTSWLRREWGLEVPAADVRVVTDVMTGVREAIRAVTDEGDPVLVPTPVYPPFLASVKVTGRELVTVPMTDQGRLDLDAVGAAMAALPGIGRSGGRRAALLLSNPHNPTGVAHTAEELRGLAALAAEHGVTLVSDEIHAPLVLPGASFTPLLSLPEAAGALAVISPAKGWNLAGLKAAALLAGPTARDALAAVPEEVSWTVGHVAATVHVAAMDDGGPWLADLVADLDANRALLADLVAEHLPGVATRPVEATYLAWLDVRGTGLTYGRVLREARVALMDGPAFGPGGAGHLRLNLATSPAVLTAAVRRIGTLLDSAARA